MISSGATRPKRAPPSIERLHSVSRASIDIARTAEPAYSMACPRAPSAPRRAIQASAASLAVTPGPSRPSIRRRMALGRACHTVCVASTCATSVAPMPKASAPNAPWVEVWLSPQTTSVPGRVRPSSGPTTWTIPRRGSPRPRKRTPAAPAFRASRSIMEADAPSAWDARVGA